MNRHVLSVCGSLQATSANRAALDVVRAYLERYRPLPVTVDDADELGTIIAFNPDRQSDPGAAVTSFRQRIAVADTVVFATPEYAGALPGALKNALDWIVGSAELYANPVVVISAGTTGGGYAREQLIRALTWQGAHVVGELGIAAPRTKSDADGRLTDPVTIAAIEELAQLTIDAPTQSPADRLARVHEVIARFGISGDHVAPVR